jgi:hypothetical protein
MLSLDVSGEGGVASGLCAGGEVWGKSEEVFGGGGGGIEGGYWKASCPSLAAIL